MVVAPCSRHFKINEPKQVEPYNSKIVSLAQQAVEFLRLTMNAGDLKVSSEVQ